MTEIRERHFTEDKFKSLIEGCHIALVVELLRALTPKSLVGCSDLLLCPPSFTDVLPNTRRIAIDSDLLEKEPEVDLAVDASFKYQC